MKLEANETALKGQWVFDGATQRGDAVCERIEWLVEHALERVANSPQWGDWEILYRDPTDFRYWELTYPQGEMQGGGPPLLRLLDAATAASKYSVKT